MSSLLAKLGLFAGGVLFGTAGIKILSSKDAKKVYTEATAAALRAKDCVMTTVTTVKENADDILADAKEINESVPLRTKRSLRMPRKAKQLPKQPKPPNKIRCYKGFATA